MSKNKSFITFLKLPVSKAVEELFLWLLIGISLTWIVNNHSLDKGYQPGPEFLIFITFSILGLTRLAYRLWIITEQSD